MQMNWVPKYGLQVRRKQRALMREMDGKSWRDMEWIWGGMEAKDFTSGGGCLGSRKGVYELEEE